MTVEIKVFTPVQKLKYALSKPGMNIEPYAIKRNALIEVAQGQTEVL